VNGILQNKSGGQGQGAAERRWDQISWQDGIRHEPSRVDCCEGRPAPDKIPKPAAQE
jgi:hypothetical protein